MYIELDVHKKLSYYSMVDGEGTEVNKGRFPTTCEGNCISMETDISLRK